MNLQPTDLAKLLALAKQTAKEAGTLIQQFANNKLEVQTKDGGESYASQVLTKADIASQELIMHKLMPSIDRYNLAVLSEEAEDTKTRLDKDYFWCIDPLDGTLPFIEGVAGYSVSIALVQKDGQSVLGVIYDPLKENMYTAIKGQAAKLNGKPLFSANNNHLTLVTDRSFFKYPQKEELIELFEGVAKQFKLNGLQLIEKGGGAMNAMWVLENAPAIYIKLPKAKKGGGSIWDFAASACIVPNTGGWASNIFGAPLNLNNPKSTFMNEKGVLYASSKQLGEQLVPKIAGLSTNTSSF